MLIVDQPTPLHIFCKSILNRFHAEATFVHHAEICKMVLKPSKPCHVGIQWKALAEYYQMSSMYPHARVLVISNFFLLHFVLAKLATNSQRVNYSDFAWHPYNNVKRYIETMN